MTVTLLPSAAALTVALLKADPDLTAITAGRVGTKLNQTLPAIRVQRIGGSPDAYNGTDAPSMQLECWAADEGTADTLVRTLIAVLPTFRHRDVTGGRVHTYTITSGPFWAPDDPSLSNNARYIITVELLTTS